MPTFSIIVPTYNRAHVVGNAIESVLAQTLSDWEMVIVDDGSNDNTAELVKRFNNPRITYLYQDNKGPSNARNKGMLAAAGHWIAYLDSDNELLKNYLEAMHDAFAERSDAVYAWANCRKTLELYENDKLLKVVDDSRELISDHRPQSIVWRTIPFDTTGFVHLSSLVREGLRWDDSLRLFEDWDFFMMVAENYPDKFLYLDKVLVNYHQRYGGDGIVANTSYKQWAEGFERIYQKHKNDKLMQGQRWYPQRVEMFLKLQRDYEAGKARHPNVRYVEWKGRTHGKQDDQNK
jgi:glycosyltransferase involved in cell wall biosynthesis